MKLLAFLVLAGLGLVILLTYTKRHRNRDRWPYNLVNPSDTSGAASNDPTWSPSTNTLIAAGTLTVLGDNNSPLSSAQHANDTTANAGSISSSSEHGATGSWGVSGDSSSGSSNAGDSGGDGGGGDGSGD